MEVASNRNCLINWNNWSCFPLGTETMKWIEIRKEICISSWFCKQWACFIPTKILEKSTHQKLKKGNVLKVVAIISLCRIDWSLFILSLESNTFYKTTKQQLANNSLWAKCGLPSVFVWPAKQECLEQFLNDWKKSKEHYFMGCENYIDVSVQCPSIKFYWNTVISIYLFVYGCFHRKMAELSSCNCTTCKG